MRAPRRRLGGSQRGSTVVTAVLLAVLMMSLGFTGLALVDVQTREARAEASRDAAYNLAEGLLSAQAGTLARAWPATPTTDASPCTRASAGVPRCVDPAAVLASFTGPEYADPAWRVDVRDDAAAHATDWDDLALTSAVPWDGDGDGEVWIRAQATANGQTRAVVARVRVSAGAAVPEGYGVLAGRFSTDLGVTLDQVTAGPLLTPLIGGDRLIAGGAVGLRCGVLTGCLTGVFSALTEVGLSTLFANEIVQHHSTQAASDAVIASLRSRAVAAGTYTASLTAGAACPAPPPLSPQAVVFVEQVGDGDGTCSLVLAPNTVTRAGALVIARGRVAVSGSGTFQGVLMALNQQRAALGDTPREVVRIDGHAKVVGAVLADGAGGAVGLRPPPLDPFALIDQLPVCNGLLAILCGPLKTTLRALGAAALVTRLVDLVGLGGVVNGLLGQLSSYGPAIRYDQATVSALTVTGAASTVAGSLREVPVQP